MHTCTPSISTSGISKQTSARVRETCGLTHPRTLARQLPDLNYHQQALRRTALLGSCRRRPQGRQKHCKPQPGSLKSMSAHKMDAPAWTSHQHTAQSALLVCTHGPDEGMENSAITVSLMQVSALHQPEPPVVKAAVPSPDGSCCKPGTACSLMHACTPRRCSKPCCLRGAVLGEGATAAAFCTPHGLSKGGTRRRLVGNCVLTSPSVAKSGRRRARP